MTKPNLVILGAGIEAAWVIDILAVLDHPFEILGLIDLGERGVQKGTLLEGHQILGTLDELLSVAESANYYVAATRDNRARADAARRAEVCGIYPAKVFHPRATLANSARVEPGTILHPGASIGPHAVVRAGCIIATHASIDGFSTVGPFAHLDVGARIAGRCEIGSFVTVGPGSVILPKVRIGQGAVIAPSSVVVRDVEEFCIVSGYPARVIDRVRKPRDPSTSIYEQAVSGHKNPPQSSSDTTHVSATPPAPPSAATPADAPPDSEVSSG